MKLPLLLSLISAMAFAAEPGRPEIIRPLAHGPMPTATTASALAEAVPARPDEPLARSFSAERAAQSLAAGSNAWLKNYSCVQCHAVMMQPQASLALREISPPPQEAIRFMTDTVNGHWQKSGVRYDNLPATGKTLLMRDAKPPVTEPLSIALPMTQRDRHDSGRLSDEARKALLKMAERQRADGGFNVARDGVPEMLHEFDQALLAAIAIGTAPEGVANAAPFKTALEGIRRYIAAHPADCAWQQGMLLWAEAQAGGFLTSEARQQAMQALLARQRADGGWSLPDLLTEATRRQYHLAADAPADGYATGFVLFVARQSGAAKDDPRLQRGVAWLKTHQRQSGRWFLASLVGRKGNLISNAATAWAVLGLRACDALPPGT